LQSAFEIRGTPAYYNQINFRVISEAIDFCLEISALGYI